MQLVENHVFSVLCSVKICKFCTVFARVMKHARHSLFIIASVLAILCAQITVADILRIIQTPRERKWASNLNLSKWTYTVEWESYSRFYLIFNKLLNNLVKYLDMNDGQWRHETGDVTKNFNEKLQIYLSFEELNEFFTLLHLAFSNLIHAGISLHLF